MSPKYLLALHLAQISLRVLNTHPSQRSKPDAVTLYREKDRTKSKSSARRLDRKFQTRIRTQDPGLYSLLTVPIGQFVISKALVPEARVSKTEHDDAYHKY